MSESQEPKIIVDSEWKSRVETEKEKLKQQEEQQPHEPMGELPPASFPMLVSTLVTQALVGLGQIPDPFSGQPEVNLAVAGHYIDTLGILEQKTKGNLTPDESDMLTEVLHQLRMAFVAIRGAAPAMPKSGTIEIP